MFIPHGTDAPIYHLPIVTILAVALNIGLFFAEPFINSNSHYEIPVVDWVVQGGYNGPRHFLLEYGAGIKPWQGISCAFLHANFAHLVGNMIFLSVFGVIVEGKLVWWKFLTIYLGIAVFEGLLIQGLLMIFNPDLTGGALGASGVIMGLMAIAILWAPLNNVEVTVFWSRVQFSYGLHHFDIPVALFAGSYVLFDIIISIFLIQGRSGFVPTTPILHAVGAIIGGVIGLAMLKLNLVDCENFDVFSVLSGRHELSTTERLSEDSDAKAQSLVDQGMEQVRAILNDKDNPRLAYRAHISMRQKYDSWRLPSREFLILIKQLCDQYFDHEAALAMEEYLQTDRPKQNQVRLKLAALLIDSMHQLSQAEQQLLSVSYDELSMKEKALYQQLAAKLNSLRTSGGDDRLDDDW